MKKISIISLLLAFIVFISKSTLSDNVSLRNEDTAMDLALDADRQYLDSLWHAQYPDITIQHIDTTLIIPPGISDSPDKAPAQGIASYIPVSVEIDRSKAVGEIPINSKVSDTGAKCYEIPISVYPGMNGHQPELTMVYNSQGGNGIMGYGWSLSGVSSISAVPKNPYFDGTPEGVKVTSEDAFQLDGTRLITKESQETYKLYQSEYGNIKAKGYLKDGKIQYFEVFYPDGRKGTYGSTSLPSRINYPVTSLKDIHGNNITYTYSYSSNTYRLENITYNGCSVVFGYIGREDPYSNYRGGVRQVQSYLLSPITCKIGSETLGTYRMTYNTDKRVALLESVGYDSQGITYAYDSYGNISKETYADGRSITRSYDSHHRLTREEADGLITVRTYSDKGDLSKITSSNGWSKTFTYDDKGRVTASRENGLDGLWLQKDLIYSGGHVSSVKYGTKSTSIAKESYSYTNGYLSGVSFNGKSIYKLTSQTALGAEEKVTLSGLSVEKTYDAYGYPTAEKVSDPVKGTVYQNFGYQFKASNNTLLMRKDEIRKNMDVFSYDNLNRLTRTASGSGTYDGLGNILSKSDVGTFSYGLEGNPYAMSGAELSQTGLMAATQTVSYNSFRRPSSVSENGYKASFTYSGDYDRISMALTYNGATKLTRHYLGGCYEADKTSSSLKEKIYLSGGYYGASAVYVTDGGTGKLYFILRDYLGSITHVIDEEGNVKQELGYDAWGRLRASMNGSAYAPGTEPELFLGRGYTGHEHLPMFGLVNMNSRLYDPVTGRFLSPDPVMEMSEGTQGFTRYAYAMNNPLCYVDEDGEMPVILVAALIGGAINLTSKLISGQVNNFQDGLAAFGIGAIAGMGGAVGGALGYCLTGAGGLVGGMAAGLLGNAASMPLQSWGNSLYFHDPFMTSQEYVTGMAFGALSGGLTNGVTAGLQGRNVWTGKEISCGQSIFSITPTPVELEVNVMYSQGNQTSAVTTKVKPNQLHHFATNKHRYFTPRFKQLLSALGLDLNGSWNKQYLPHQGRHPNVYHQWVLDQIEEIIALPQMGNLHGLAKQVFFTKKFNENVVKEVVKNPDMLYKKYWMQQFH